jgi:uncharacterized protein
MDTRSFTDELTPEVCRTLLASHDVGRIAFVGDGDDPVVFPVNYLLHGDDIVLRTDRGETGEHVPMRRVAFEVDHIDNGARTGWSVLVRGAGREIDEPTDLDMPSAWAPGDKPRWIAIAIDRISGRHIVHPRGDS